MKFAHLSDLHLGKLVNGYSMIEDQKYVLEQVVNICVEEKVDAVLIAGDVYDRFQPSLEAMNLLDGFLTSLHQAEIPVLLTAGNHDSGDRIGFAQKLLQKSDIFVEGVYEGCLKPIIFHDEYGPINFYLLPFLRPSYVNRWIENENEKVSTFEEAFAYVIQHTEIDKTKRNVLIAHQFVTGAEIQVDGSEELLVGGLDQISYEVFKPFDYVALGHIHSFQQIAKRPIYYCGTILPYSFAEANDKKGVFIVTIKNKNELSYQQVPLHPLHKMSRVKGMFHELMDQSMIAKYEDDYLDVTLFDEVEILDAALKLKAYYPYLMRLQYENQTTKNNTALTTLEEQVNLSPIDLFDRFFYEMHHMNLSEEQRKYLQNAIDEIEEGGDVF